MYSVIRIGKLFGNNSDFEMHWCVINCGECVSILWVPYNALVYYPADAWSFPDRTPDCGASIQMDGASPTSS